MIAFHGWSSEMSHLYASGLLLNTRHLELLLCKSPASWHYGPTKPLVAMDANRVLATFGFSYLALEPKTLVQRPATYL